MADGWDITNYKKNPVILWGHNYWDMKAIIGACDKIGVEEIEGKKCLVMEGVFAKTEEGQYVRRLYDDGILKTVSVGFIPKERNGNQITKQELLELSFCGVPSNPDAVSLEKFAKGMVTKTLEVLTGAKAEDMDALVSKLRTDLQSSVDTFVESMAGEAGDDDTTADDEEETVPPTEEEAVKIVKILNQKFRVKNPGSSELSPTPTPAEEEEKAKQIVDLKAQVTALEAHQKSGRVLSAKNLALVDGAIEALKALREASEPEKAQLSGTAKELQIDLQSFVKLLEKSIKNAKTLTTNL